MRLLRAAYTMFYIRVSLSSYNEPNYHGELCAPVRRLVIRTHACARLGLRFSYLRNKSVSIQIRYDRRHGYSRLHVNCILKRAL